MTAALDALRDRLAQIACDVDQRALRLPLVNLTRHPFALADYRERMHPYMGPINEWALHLLAGADAELSWDPATHPCHQRNDDGRGPLVCVRTDAHTTHTFAATAGLNLKATEATE